MNNDATLESNQKISMDNSDFDETLLESNFFGYGVAGIGDYDNNNILDIAVSVPSSSNQALYILHLTRKGKVKTRALYHKISLP